MNKYLMVLFIVLSFIDSRDDSSKTYLVIEYDSGIQDKILIDKRQLLCKSCIWKAVQQVLDKHDL